MCEYLGTRIKSLATLLRWQMQSLQECRGHRGSSHSTEVWSYVKHAPKT